MDVDDPRQTRHTANPCVPGDSEGARIGWSREHEVHCLDVGEEAPSTDQLLADALRGDDAGRQLERCQSGAPIRGAARSQPPSTTPTMQVVSQSARLSTTLMLPRSELEQDAVRVLARPHWHSQLR